MWFGAIWGAKVLDSEETVTCAQDDGVKRFRNVVFAYVIIAYMYAIYLVLFLCCLGGIGCMVARMPEMQRRAEFERRANNIPMAREAMEHVNKKKFSEFSKEKRENIDKCVICYEEFKDDDELAELNCAGKHIFHQACI